MGKGTKHAGDWKMTTLKVAIDARNLFRHSVKIMGNERKFNPSNDFHGMTLERIFNELLDLYLNTWDANRINVVKRPERINERLSLQESAMRCVQRLLALFELAKSQFHIEHGKFWNWMNMLVDVGKELSAWNKSDIERYVSNGKNTNNLGNQSGRKLNSAQVPT